MKSNLVATFAIIIGLTSASAAFGDAHFTCEYPGLWGISVTPTSVGLNQFRLQLHVSDPLLTQLGLPANQDYLLTGAFSDCRSNPDNLLATYCDTWGASPQVSSVAATGLTDHLTWNLNFLGISLASTVDLTTNENGTLNYMRARINFSTDQEHSVQKNIFFQIPLPGAPENSPSQCE